uniref:Cilia- and flagella-associated protein HOATZ n=1 Tax=Sinocyclocheilus grahami TaxID=75366 RepID=A0A672SVL5_SINGR
LSSSLTIMTEELDKEVLDSVAEIDKLYTVFDGASQEDVAYAKVFWSSLSLQPPIESRLVSADIRQRLNVAKTPNYKDEIGVCERNVFFLI